MQNLHIKTTSKRENVLASIYYNTSVGKNSMNTTLAALLEVAFAFLYYESKDESEAERINKAEREYPRISHSSYSLWKKICTIKRKKKK